MFKVLTDRLLLLSCYGNFNGRYAGLIFVPAELGDRLCAFWAAPRSQLFYVDGFCPPFTGGRFHSDVVVAVATFSVATVQ